MKIAALPLLLVPALAGCAARATPSSLELLTAEAAVAQAKTSPLAHLAPAELREAERSLWIAEQLSRTRPASQAARDAAYVAERKAQCAQLASLVRSERDELEAAQRTAEQLRAIQGLPRTPPTSRSPASAAPEARAPGADDPAAADATAK